jgi:DNA repair exonuclease SbcCD ATPase subunit
MRLSALTLSGFRGFKQSCTIPFGRGFTLITGRNGSGKTTICDAVEFILTGEISRFSDDTERNERIADYLWWRGPAEGAARSISLSFADSEGHEHLVSGPDDLRAVASLLYDPCSAPSEPVRQLCRMSIIRDETITRLSTDLPETDRFNLVRESIGLSELGRFERRAKEWSRQLKANIDSCQVLRSKAHEKVVNLEGQLSSIQAQAGRSGKDLKTVRNSLSTVLSQLPEDASSLIPLVRSFLESSFRRIEALERLRVSLQQFLDSKEKVLNADADRKRIELETELRATKDRLTETLAKLDALNSMVRNFEAASPEVTALALLRQGGTGIGLQNGMCPLCGSAVTAKDFEAHLDYLRLQVDKHNADLAEIVRQRAGAEKARAALQATCGQLENQRRAILEQAAQFQQRSEALGRQSVDLNVKMSDNEICSAIQEGRERSRVPEEGLAALNALSALSSVTEVETKLAVARGEEQAPARYLRAVTEALAATEKAEDITRRLSGQIIDERLDALSPLLTELYARLRPHVEWPEIKYFMRGDVRRFLSFQVGDSLNPRFIFSAGQKRALGLAFLLAVHLSRPWCKIKTLILDDPVQHIDDYRALQVVETLSALRQSGHQIICTVEDPALAALLCRRLRVRQSGEGVRVDLEYKAGEGVIAKVTETGPLASEVLLSA